MEAAPTLLTCSEALKKAAGISFAVLRIHMTIKKTDISRTVADNADIPLKEAKAVVESFLNSLERVFSPERKSNCGDLGASGSGKEEQGAGGIPGQGKGLMSRPKQSYISGQGRS